MPQHRTSEIDAGPLVNVGTNNTWTTLVVGLQQLPPNSDGLKLELPSVNEDLDLDTPCEVYCRRTEAGRRFTVYLVMILALFSTQTQPPLRNSFLSFHDSSRVRGWVYRGAPYILHHVS